jgi:hypothetical protein
MRAFQFQTLLWDLIAVSDSGKYDDVSVDEVYRHLRAGSLPNFLVGRFNSEINLSIVSESDWPSLIDEWGNFANAIDAERKYGIAKRGISLLMAYALESMHQRRERE